MRVTTDELCRQAGFEPDISFECEDLPTLQSYVAAGLGVAVIPASWNSTPDLMARPVHHLQLKDPGAVREIGMAWSTERRLLPAAELFLAHVTQDAAEMRG